jgi:Chaperone of endosialidase/Secretion system C-terminal sorting domain
MKRFFSTVCLTVFFGCFLGKAQVTRNSANFNQATNPATQPPDISQFEVSGRLITQNGFVSLNPIPATQQTGTFNINSRWNSMGGLRPSATSPVLLNGFRTQTDGRGLTMGYITSNTVPTTAPNSALTNPFIEWIGNTGVATPGNLDFKYAFDPTGGNRVPAFTIEPNATSFSANAGANAYTNKGFIGQLQSGVFGNFGLADRWSATGQITTPSFTTYGARQQYEGYTVNSGLLKDAAGKVDAVLDFGCNLPVLNTGPTQLNGIFKFRTFTNPNLLSSNKNIWQSSSRFGNIVLGRQDYGAVNSRPFYLSLFDGFASNTTSIATNFVERAGIFATSDSRDENGLTINNYASIMGDLSGTFPNENSTRYAILGITSGSSFGTFPGGNGSWAGYFVGDVNVTGALFYPSDKKFKKMINVEENMLSKLMLLQPKNYYFDTEKNKNMAFGNQLQHGLISQELEEVFPELVRDVYGPSTNTNPKENGKPEAYKGINYMGFIPMLLKGIQELKIENDALKIKVENLEVKNNNNTFVINDKTNLPAEIENKAFTLSQNTPNPFSEKTTISYTIPSNVKKATLAVFDLTGKMLLQFNLAQGKNNLTISGNTLPAGMYLYSLLADGQEVLSKRMVLTK